ncbi:MAG TPA: dienelactone hydrolase family protein [Candidatus Limnocylindria bacterium]|jgi:carboxymethylenebutenolidase|nr:dienelactone hydrolase family protein [Candidatus Limnocylindria bacterium]
MTTPHDDIDPTITVEWVQIERDGSTMRAYVAAPRDTTPSTPSVVLAMHLWGLDRGTREAARRFAVAGFATIVPDLYARLDTPDPDATDDVRAFVPLARSLAFETVDPDIRASARWIRARFPDGKTAIAGFCMGGVIATYRTAGYADLFSAAAVWYGLHRQIDPANVEIPIVASYGADDTGIPVADVERFRAGLRVPHDVVVYPNAEHGFADRRAAYQKDAAEDSWRRAIGFLTPRLRA